eukprot:10602910-Alexandrium_andersonii.AAC.1
MVLLAVLTPADGEARAPLLSCLLREDPQLNDLIAELAAPTDGAVRGADGAEAPALLHNVGAQRCL